jgi:hypothetical protein
MSTAVQPEQDETMESVTPDAGATMEGGDHPLTPSGATGADPITPSEPTDGEDGTPPEGDPTQPAGDLDAEGRPTAKAPPAPKPTPFEARVMGTKYAAQQLKLDGAVVRSDGTVEVPATSAPRLSQLIAKGRMYEEHVPQQIHELREQVRQSQSQFVEDAERGKALYEFFGGLVGQGEQAIYDFLTDWASNKPRLDGQVERMLAKAEREHAMRAAPSAGPMNLPSELIEQQAQDAAWQETMKAIPQHKGLSVGAAQDIAEKLWRNKALYIAVADRDYPEYGVVRGQPVFNTRRWNEDFAERADLVTKAAVQVAKAAKVAPKVSQAAAGNQAVVSGSAGKAPPPPPKGAASAKGKAAPQSAEEYQKYMRAKYNL